LRNALLRQALALPELESMSLRQLAAAVGVSAAAVYRHFDSREQLLFELVGIGFDRLSAAFEQACPADRAPANALQAIDRLERLGRAYLQFAQDEPALWRLMFGPLGAPYRARGPCADAARPSTYDALPAALQALHEHGVLARPPGPDDVLFTWAGIHGLAALREGRVPGAARSVASLARMLVLRLLAALGGEAPASPGVASPAGRARARPGG